ncbi:hypothetical protein Acr_24g0006070 [Actinidia rufa]|uniref:Uncharacterized protein n=1 Tax=Actinidia rufa TaxID=165716 RepID=A0A7J0GU99_9ERIC|nr:hypothetical protein Acr_24g0006070 [Actinidia rufa]
MTGSSSRVQLWVKELHGSRGHGGKRCNKLPIMTDTEVKTRESSLPLVMPRCPLVEGTTTYLEMVWLPLRVTRVSPSIPKMNIPGVKVPKIDHYVKEDQLSELAKKVEESKAATSSTKAPGEGTSKKPGEVLGSRASIMASAVALGEGTSKKPGEVLGARASVMASAAVAEKILARVILHVDKEKVNKLFLELGGHQVSPHPWLEGGAGVFPFYTKQGHRKHRRLLDRSGKFSEEAKKANAELQKKSEDAVRLEVEVEVVELRKEEALAKRKVIEEFKSSKDFQEAVENASSKYFG